MTYGKSWKIYLPSHCSCLLPPVFRSLLMTEVEPRNLARAPGGFIDIDYRSADANFAGRVMSAPIDSRGEARDDVRFVHANDARITSGHPQVSDKGRTFGKDAFIRSLHVRMRAHYRGNPPIQIPGHSRFF